MEIETLQIGETGGNGNSGAADSVGSHYDCGADCIPGTVDFF